MPNKDIDVLESILRRQGDLLDILLIDRTKSKPSRRVNIIWATDSYVKYGKDFAPKKQILPELVTGRYNKLIQPRAIKSKEEQKQRTRDKAEVFTPLKIVDEMNSAIDRAGGENLPGGHTWQDYIRELKLEITCGEAPFIVSRYNPTSATGKLIKLENRVGFLDRKLQVISRMCDTSKEWLTWARIAYQSSYGYEWQGDNLLIARENLLYTLKDYYFAKFGKQPDHKTLIEFAEIISWNIFQMDGIKFVVPMSCRHETIIEEAPPALKIIGEAEDVVHKFECRGCKLGDPFVHNSSYYARTMDWGKNKPVKFIDLLDEGEKSG